MAKTYYLRFGEGDPRAYAGISPTLVIFKLSNGTNVTAPSLTEVTGTGIFSFSWGTTTSIAFIADSATTGLGLSGSGRYVTGSIDPADRTDEYASTMIALGTTSVAIGTTGVALGITGAALGTSGIALGITAIALGTTNVALGTSIYAGITTISGYVTSIGSTASSFGTVNTDPTDLFGYMKRVVENLEGDQTFIKGAGTLTISDRAGSVTLALKTITNSITTVIRT